MVPVNLHVKAFIKDLEWVTFIAPPLTTLNQAG